MLTSLITSPLQKKSWYYFEPSTFIIVTFFEVLHWTSNLDKAIY